jgi:hypothetical protein
MKISNIGRNIVPVDSTVIKQAEPKVKETETKKITKNNPDYFSQTVSQLADSLKDINQVANNHPLGRSDYRPIDNFDEAKNLLSYFQTPEYKNVALDVHSQINNQSAAYLFTE